MSEIEPGTRIEHLVAQQILGMDTDTSVLGLAVTVEATSADVSGIARTHQARTCPVLETSLDIHKSPAASAKGTIFAIDERNNALWLRPQRLTTASTNAGFLVVTSFMREEQPAYSVTVREPGWRDKTQINRIPGIAWRPTYPSGGLPDLLDEDWARLQVQDVAPSS